jgi:hypothetical protein
MISLSPSNSKRSSAKQTPVFLRATFSSGRNLPDHSRLLKVFLESVIWYSGISSIGISSAGRS